MASDSEDSEGEELSMIRPSLIQELRNVLDLYPDDGQILKELIQNAEDAGATEVKVVTDKRTFHQHLDPGTLRKHPHLKFFQGPALCVYNNAEFTADDWKGIRMLHTSIKEEDPLKVGRFGLGFKSVFHLTDRLMILSGSHMMYMDPFKGEDHYCKRHRVGSRRRTELDSIMTSLEGVFGVSRDLFQAGDEGHFPGTLFWFPLRQTPSALSDTVYGHRSLDQLLDSFKAEASSLLLFLNHVLAVSVLTRDDDEEDGGGGGGGDGPREVFSVGVTSACLEEVKSERRKFVEAIRSVRDVSGLPDNEVTCLTHVVMETRDHAVASSVAESQRWLVVNYHSGKQRISRKLHKLCSDPQLSYRPYVGVAVPLSGHGGGPSGDFQSQVYCFLPLPLDTRSPTGLPLHVHGYFALEQNRRHVKWPTADQLRSHATLDKPSLWNTLLVTELLPRVYCLAINRLKDLNGDDPEAFYAAWPDVSNVQDRWRPLVPPVYDALQQEAVFHSDHQGGCWVQLQDAVLQRFPAPFPPDVERAVVRVYTLSQQPLVDLPPHVHRSLQELGLLKDVEVLQAPRVSQLTAHALPQLQRAERLCLLHYLYRSDKRLLLDQPLLPLADGESWATFKARPTKKSKKGGHVPFTHWCPKELVQLFPGLETEFCDVSVPDDITDDLRRFSETGLSTLDQLHRKDPRIPALLNRSLRARLSTEEAVVDISDPWLQRVWRHLANVDDLSTYSAVPLLPVKVDPAVDAISEGYWRLSPLAGVYVVSHADGFAPLPPALTSALTLLGVTVLDTLPDYIASHKAVLGHFVNHPSNRGLLKALRKTETDAALRTNATSLFNAKATEQEKAALVHFVANVGNTEGELPSLFKKLELFTNVTTKEPASVCQVPHVGPEDLLPPVPVPTAFLLCDPIARRVAVSLGAEEMTLLELVGDIMESMASDIPQYSQDDVTQFMTYFLNNQKLMKDPFLLDHAKRIRFVRNESKELKTAGDLYDPTSKLLQELFHTQRDTLFPSGQFGQDTMLKKLRKLGLRKDKDVKADDIVRTAQIISDMFSTPQQEAAGKMAQGLFTYLKTFGHAVDTAALQAISTIQCMPCIRATKKPKDYPKSLPFQSSPALVEPTEMSSHTLVYTTGSIMPMLTPGLPEHVVDNLQVIAEARREDVLQHLENVIQHFQQEEASQYRIILKEIFQYFADGCLRSWAVGRLQEEQCVLVESGEMFARPDRFWIQRRQADVDLKPYRFALSAELALPSDMVDVRDLLEACGSSQSQDEAMLHDVLSDIQSKHCGDVSSHADYRSDLQLVRQILDVLKLSDAARAGKNTLLPVVNSDHRDMLKFMAAKDCTVCPSLSSSIYDNLQADDESEICFVHPDIPASTALALGALALPDRALTDVDMDFSYGQREDLTDRLSKLLKEAYTDGFSVPKELIQNADDAGATKVCFLLDERDNSAFSTNLIDDNMASLQGPAIWAYNDAEFSEADFKNIITLGREKKKGDAAKVGRFGLGFNAVYNLTEVPAFVSGHRLAMFDPQNKYITKGKGGLMLDFTKQGNKALLGRMPEQFAPFQDVFGCTLKRNENCYFQGTLFRFPLRTAAQAADSKLKPDKLKTDSYSETKRREFLKMLLEKAGTLLMFTQCVKEIEVYYLPGHLADPRNKVCLMTVKKKSTPAIVQPPQMQIGGKTILQFMKDHWSKKNEDIKMKEKLSIEVTVTGEAKSICDIEESDSITHWQLAWASGTGKSAKMAQSSKQEGLVPLATVAVSVNEDRLVPLKDSPRGFYKTGHLFCFLPLPEEMVRFSLPVHINGTFALTSDRRGLLEKTEDDLEDGGSSWNPALFGDPVVRAYLLLLELVRDEASGDSDHQGYFALWPTASMGRLVDSFYHHLQSDHNKVFPVPDHHQWVAFADARFLQPGFRDSRCGKIAWECLQKFWRGPGHLVDVPLDICRLMREKGPPGSFDQKVITELAFYRDVFFPHLQDSWWQPEHRDFLLHHALMKNDQHLNQLIKDNPCIPCQCSSQLRKPSDVIHPHGQVSKLFLASEGYFPQSGAKDDKRRPGQEISQVDFGDHPTLDRLSSLGMITQELPWDRVLERARSVSQLNADKSSEEQALGRASHLLDYLSSATSHSRPEKCPRAVLESLSETAFLPVLPRPADWPFPWAGDTPPDSRLLVPPKGLFSDSLINLVSCTVPLLDTKGLRGPAGYLTTTKMKEVLKALGLIVDVDYSHQQLRECVVRQLTCVAEYCRTHGSLKPEYVQSVTCNIYNFLMYCLKLANENDVSDSIHSQLADKEVVWTGADFVQGSCVAFICQYDCSPYLFQLERGLLTYRLFFETIGVKGRFETDDVLSVLGKLYQEHASEVLADDAISLLSRLAQLLADIVKTLPDPESVDTARVYLPDSHGVLQPSSDMCVDDCDWLTESDRMKFVNGMIAPEVAQLLGVKTKKTQDFDTLTEPIPMESFGQHEKLTSRIERLLQGYTFDSSLWKELIQNADDAGATEAKLIMDFRNLGTATVPENWEVLQGPAFCFYNNKSFTTKDMQGIQNLGKGSKGQDALKIGQFGVGFNAVFHLTDVPSFWTKQDDQHDVICVLDPNCHYVRNVSREKPGTKFTNIARVAEQYPDFMSGYLSTAIDMSQPGTLFRFPLRTDNMAAVSEIKKEPVTQEDIRGLLESFKSEMATCLLFLNSLQKIGIYSVSEDGSLERQFDVSRTIGDVSRQSADRFRTCLQQASESLKRNPVSVKDIDVCEAVVQFDITDSTDRSEHWLTVHRLGFTHSKDLSPDLLTEWSNRHFRLLPRGGLAVRLGETGSDASQIRRPIKHQAFCILPLPVFTKLPVHVNGHFALDHETRRNLWDSGNEKNDVQSEWNEAIATDIIVPAYLTALQHVKKAFFPEDGKGLEVAVKGSRLGQYHDLFPRAGAATSAVWNSLTQELYGAMATQELPLFPVSCPQRPELEWVPAVQSGGFAGYFTNLTKLAMDQAQETERSKSVALTQGISARTGCKTSDEAKVKTSVKELEQVLKECNMKILEAPFRMYEDFQSSGVKDVQQVTPGSVLTFLRSSRYTLPGGCCINDLPKNVKDTPLKTAENVRKIVEFVSSDQGFLKDLEGLPLSFRQSGTLHWFSSTNRKPKPILSQFSRLLPGSADEFLHENVRRFFRVTEQTASVLQLLDIAMLASRLPLTLTDPRLRAGQPCMLDTSLFPRGEAWIQNLWKFLETELKKKDGLGSKEEVTTTERAQSAADEQRAQETKQTMKAEDNPKQRNTKETGEKEMRQKSHEVLQVLHQWCLIPVKKMEEKEPGTPESQSVLMLYPLLDLHKVVYLPASPDLSSNGALWTVLKQLPLPVLDLLDPTSIASKLVASISHPTALLHALASCADCLSESQFSGWTILNYFSNNLAILEDSSADKSKLVSALRSLPVFPSIDGRLVPVKQSVPVICLPASVPHAGLPQWRQQRQSPLILLHEESVPSELIKYLGFENVTDAQFYAQFLLPSIHSLPRCDIVTHMGFLRENFFIGVYSTDIMNEEQKQLSQQLKATAFIEAGGGLHKADQFYSPFEQVFVVMCPDSCPPEPYKNTKWEGLMTASGMVCNITDDMFLSFARALEREQSAGITKEVVEKSQTLVRHLFGRPNIERGILQLVRSIRFLLPSDWVSTKEGKQLQKIAPAFCERRLVSYAESCLEDNLHLVWSSSNLLGEWSDPDNYLSGKALKNVMSQLCLQGKSPEGKVIQHARNLCDRLGGDKGHEIFASVPENKRLLIIVMEKLYRYLEGLADPKLSALKDLKIICDIDNSQMLRPANVVMDLRLNEMIQGHIEKGPQQFGRYFDLFKRLGAAQSVTANHYVRVLSWLKEQSGNKKLDVEERKKMKTSVEGLFRCLKDGTDEQKTISEPALYLPTEHTCLHISTSLVFKDDYLGERFQNLPDGMHFFLGFQKLKIEANIPQHEIKRLPERHKVLLMSEIAHEIIPDEILQTAEDADRSNYVVSKLHHPGFVQAMVRLVFHEYQRSNKQFTEENGKEVLETLEHVSIKQVPKLKTVITMFNSAVPGTEQSKVSFTVRESGDPKTAVVFVAAKATKNWSKHEAECVHSLAIALMYVLKSYIDSHLLHSVLQHPGRAKAFLDRERVPQCSFNSALDDTLIAAAGDFVPVLFHHHLNNSFFEFYVGEHVGYEVYDREIDDDTQIGDEDIDLVFIYGIIMRYVQPHNAADASRLTRQYLVDLGPHHGRKVVNVIKLYKLVRPTRAGTDTRMVPSDQHQDDSQSAAEASRAPDMSAVLSDIRGLLTEAWQLPDQKDRKRVVKRLLLQWHPDKNPENKDFCTRVTQTIFHYVALLEKGKALPTEDGEGQDVSGEDFFTAGSAFTSRFFTNMHARGARHRRNFESEESRGGQGQGQSGSRGRKGHKREPNPQPGESGRWFRQAQADVSAAKVSLESSQRGHNWICYQCHQAVEKALKAVLFQHDADSFEIDSHDLPSLAEKVAKHVRDSSMVDLVTQLETHLGPHSRMRYPDVMAYPRVPDDVYGRSDAVFACDVASRVLAECERQLPHA